MGIRHVLVVGAGQMGAGIAQVLASAGLDVSLFDSAPGAAAKALMQIDERLVRLKKDLQQVRRTRGLHRSAF